MNDVYFGGGQKKYIPQNKLKKMKKKMKKSFEIADRLIEKEKIIKARDEADADEYLDSSLSDLTI